MKSSDLQVTLSSSEVVEIMKELSKIVVSLDRLGSYFSDKDPRGFEKELTRFVTTWRVAPSLARVRQIIDEKLDLSVGADDMDDLERAMQDVKYWTKPGS